MAENFKIMISSEVPNNQIWFLNTANMVVGKIINIDEDVVSYARTNQDVPYPEEIRQREVERRLKDAIKTS